MKLFIVKRKDGWEYDRYNNFICIAENKVEAMRISPHDKNVKYDYDRCEWIDLETGLKTYPAGWCENLDDIVIEEVDMTQKGVLLSDFNAG